MKIHSSYLPGIGGLFTLIAACIPTSLDAQQIVTNWVAYNDHRPGNLSPPWVAVTNNWGTAPRVSPYNMGIATGVGTGNLTNFYDGQQLPVTLTVTSIGAPDDFATCFSPATNSPVAGLFYHVVDVANQGAAPAQGVIGCRLSSGTGAILTFSGLNPAKHYVFRGTSVRGGSYPLRWIVATILDAQGWIDAHNNGLPGGPGVLTSNNFPADLGPGQAAYNSGDNRVGAYVGWDFITPSDTGTFSIQSTQYVGHITGGGLATTVDYGYAINAFLLAEVEAAPPTITTNPPPQTTVEQNRPFSLSVSAAGTPLFYQWYKQGSATVLGTLSTYTVDKAALGDTGDYYVRVYNPLGSVTSTVAHVTVNADVTAPAINTAFSYPNFDMASQVATLNQVIIEFTEPIFGPGIGTPANYVLSGGGGIPSSVILTNNRTVALTFSSPLAEDTDYTITVGAVQDEAGNNAAGLSAPFHSWMRGLGNALLFEHYDTGPGVDVAALTNSPVFPNNPSFHTNLWVFDTRAVYPDNSHENYGSRIRGVFIPPVSGNWIFFLRSDDRSEVSLNRNGLDPAGKQVIVAEITGADGDWNKLLSSAIPLQAGRGYYIEALQKEESGGDYIKLAARLQGTGLPTLGVASSMLDSNSLMGGYIASPLAPRDIGGALTIPAGQPADVNIEENHDAVFSVQVNNPSGLPVLYQWYRDGSEIPGANGPTYSVQVTSVDSGHTFSVRAAKVGSEVTSRAATVTVRPDTTAPHAISVTSLSTDLTTITVNFDERISQADLDEEFDYRLDGSPPSTATPGADGKSAVLTFGTPMTQGSQHTLEVVDVRDLAGNTISPNPTSLVFNAGESDRPRLSISLGVNDATLSWPAPSTGFVLEVATTLSPPSWAAVAGTPTVIGANNVMTVPRAAGMRLYRLRN